MSENIQQPAEETTQEKKFYCAERLESLGITDEHNVIRIYNQEAAAYYDVPYFAPDKDDNILIHYPTLDGSLHTYFLGKREKTYIRTRLKVPKIDKNGRAQKYETPRGSGTRTFIPPGILKKFKEKTEIETLVVIEGEFKAFKANIHGLDIVGTQGIHNTRDPESQQLLKSITDIVRDCKVKNLVLLFDADCLTVEYEANKDLSKRPFSFYSAVKNFREATKLLNIDVYFAHIKEGLEKGLDDLLCKVNGKEKEVVEEIGKLSYANQYFYCQNITDNSLHKLKSHFFINDVYQFYERYQEVIKEEEFIFNKSKYQHDGHSLQLLRPSEADEYIRVGTCYYKLTERPNSLKYLEPHMEDWKKGEISTDFIANKKFPEIFNLIKKYDGFCNVPNHVAYEPTVGTYFNKYFPFEHKPVEGPYEATMSFLLHIFGDHIEIGLDYLTLLYKNPTQILPILCLVSRENNTGKSTFLKWLKDFYSSNMTICGNEEFQNQFNDDYASKLIIAIDEGFIDKKIIKERIKAMSTANKIKLHSKGKAKQEIDFFGKFIMCSNNEDNFVQIDMEEIRWWVLKVPVLKTDDPDMLLKLKQEIPHFLHFISNREIKHPRKGRAWFDPELLKTDALAKVIQSTRTRLERNLEEFIQDYFLKALRTELKFDLEYLTTKLNEFATWKYDKTNVKDFLKDKKNMKPENVQRFKIPYYDNQGVLHELNMHGRPYLFKVEEWLEKEEVEEIERIRKSKPQYVNADVENKPDNAIVQTQLFDRSESEAQIIDDLPI